MNVVMKIMSIIGIVLFTWFCSNRYDNYRYIDRMVGKTYTTTYTPEVIKRAYERATPQVIVSIYGLLYAVVATVYSFKKNKEHS